jgi:NADPH:quinone reductase-like Zn-dependent oxidoreductase
VRGALFHVASEAVQIPLFTPLGLMDANRTVAGVNIGHLWGEAALLREELDALVGLYRANRIRPHVDTTYGFAEAADAHRRIESRKNVGKVVLVP